MSRALLLACGLILIGAVAAGCGSGYDGAVRREAKQFLGNGHPTILRIETVRDLAGNKMIVARVHGQFHLPPGHFAPVLPTPRPKPQPIHYAWLSFQPGQPSEMGGEAVTNASQLAAIDNAHNARPMFSIFPDFLDMAISCAIPKGNSSGTIAGFCSTAVEGTFDHVREIRFHEAWSFADSHEGYLHQRRKGGWIVSLDRNEHVQSVRRFGDLPPQLWQ